MFTLGKARLTVEIIEKIIYQQEKIAVADDALLRIERRYRVIEKDAFKSTAIYGVNTGFGALAEQRIEKSQQETLQKNIILSHAVGLGAPLDFACAKTLTLLRLNTLVQAYSGASPQLINHLLTLLNKNCAPLVPQKGSVGASGDLAPLAHLGLLLLGIGDAFVNGKRKSAQEVLAYAGLTPLTLGIRDGLALINGTQAMASRAALAITACERLSNLADICGASSLEALAGHLAPFDEKIHAAKPYAGQIKSAQNIRNLCMASDVRSHVKNPRTQDQYSLRCMPQVHGASKDVLAHVKECVEIELNAICDNPLFFFDKSDQSYQVLSGGNFHGQRLALALDYLAMAVSELANIAERRIELLLNPHHSNGLPAFLIKESGLNSGYMMMHVTASALVNENKVLCHPASTDSIPTSANREDHVSMGMTSANKLWQIIDNTKNVLAIELLCAHQAIGLRSEGQPALRLKQLHETLRQVVPQRNKDALFGTDLEIVINWLAQGKTHNYLKSLIFENAI